MRCRRRPYQGEEDVWSGGVVSRGTGDGEDSAGAGGIAGAGDEGTVLPDCRERDILGRGQEDGSADGELSASYR